jgi:type I restriction enzyme S subunit
VESAGRKIGFLHKEVAFGNKLCSFEPLKVDYKYLYYFLQCPIFQTQFKNGMTGMIGGVGINKIREFKIPVPLIEEQIEIVKKLDNFFNLFN